MSQRATSGKPRDPDAWYREPAWCAERLFQDEAFPGGIIDPCAGTGTIVRAARAAGLRAEGFDLRDRGARDLVQPGVCFFTGDYLPGTWPCANIVSNPPYATWLQLGRDKPSPDAMARSEDEFLRIALRRTIGKVAVLLPTGWISADERSRWIESLPFYREYRLTPRPSIPSGGHLAEGGKRGGGKTDFSWFVFLNGFQGDPTVHFLRRDD
ncbi:hypothetical protein [Pseudogemmobacter sonorensis]|uniref:hypothetical protein n=1 Tax=Pseudogemmobacter sonorensis TaxID=2989681 RepID=UPI0036CA9EB2